MTRYWLAVLDVAVLVVFVAASVAVMFAAPAGPPVAVVTYVVLVELPTVFLLGRAIRCSPWRPARR